MRPKGWCGSSRMQRADRHFVEFGLGNGGDVAVIFDGTGNRSLDPGAEPLFYGLSVGDDGRIVFIVDMQDEGTIGAKIMPVRLVGEAASLRRKAMDGDDADPICVDLEAIDPLEVGGLAKLGAVGVRGRCANVDGVGQGNLRRSSMDRPSPSPSSQGASGSMVKFQPWIWSISFASRSKARKVSSRSASGSISNSRVWWVLSAMTARV